MPMLTLENITAGYIPGVEILRGASLHVEQGEIVCLVGPNGAGKSTTMRMILGLVHPSGGSVQISGIDTARDRRTALARVGAVVEKPGFYLQLSGWENLAIFSSLGGGADRARMEEILEVVGLLGREHDPVAVYSHGMRQRLGIAQALLPDPELILLDEPGDGLDPKGSREIRQLIRRLADERRLTIFLSSHFLHEVEQLCNRVAILNKGRLLYQGSVEGLVTQETHLRVGVDRVQEAREFLAALDGVSVLFEDVDALTLRLSGVQAPWVNEQLVGKGFRVHQLAAVRETLETVFLRLTGGEGDNAA